MDACSSAKSVDGRILNSLPCRRLSASRTVMASSGESRASAGSSNRKPMARRLRRSCVLGLLTGRQSIAFTFMRRGVRLIFSVAQVLTH